MMKLFNKLKWHRIGYTEGHVKITEQSTLVAKSILYVRDPFLWFKTRKAVYIGDYKEIEGRVTASPHYRKYKMDVEDWLMGGKIDYVSENGTNRPADIIKLVKE
jgi:hypothetical protein